jgi:hypothetical protein
MIDRVAKTLFLFGLAVLLALAGIVAGLYRLPPARQVEASIAAIKDWKGYWRSYLGIRPSKYLRRAPYPGDGVVLHRPGEVQPGVTLMTGLWDSMAGLTLRTLDGKELHRWRFVFSQLWPDTPHLSPEEIPFNDWDTHIHGAVLYPEGDVVFNFEYAGLTRLDRCGRVVWRLPYRTHHAVSTDEHGNLWAVGIKQRHVEATDRFPGLAPPFAEESIVQVSPTDGRILREISLLDVIYGSSYEGVLFATGQDEVLLESEDPLHANHVEVLPSSMDAAFPLFDAGDILVSMRELNLLMVIDGKTAKVKWAKTGPWLRQHDPHFLPNGQISVFDNRRIDNPGHAAGGKPRFASRLVTVDPQSGRVSVVYEGTLEQPFFTPIMGKHQYLPNGNILISEPLAGRAFEITPDGRMVWSFISRFNADRISILEQATRYPESYAAFTGAACPEAESDQDRIAAAGKGPG